MLSTRNIFDSDRKKLKETIRHKFCKPWSLSTACCRLQSTAVRCCCIAWRSIRGIFEATECANSHKHKKGSWTRQSSHLQVRHCQGVHCSVRPQYCRHHQSLKHMPSITDSAMQDDQSQVIQNMRPPQVSLTPADADLSLNTSVLKQHFGWHV